MVVAIHLLQALASMDCTLFSESWSSSLTPASTRSLLDIALDILQCPVQPSVGQSGV